MKPAVCTCYVCIKNGGIPPYEAFVVSQPSSTAPLGGEPGAIPWGHCDCSDCREARGEDRFAPRINEYAMFANEYGFTIVETQLLVIANDYGWSFVETAKFISQEPISKYGPVRTPARIEQERAFYNRWAAAMREHPGRPLIVTPPRDSFTIG